MRIYFSGLGGVGIGPLAEIAADAGYLVVGSDLSESPVTQQLRQRGVTVHIGQDGSALQAEHDSQPIDWFVYTSALPADHPELVLAGTLGIRTSKRDELLAEIIRIRNLQLIAVAGTHGKTTTTAMVTWLFQRFEQPVSYSVGAPVSFGPSGLFNAASRYFVYECDEFDRNFLHYHPRIAGIVSVDYDHVDTYPTREDYKQAFRDFITRSDTTYLWEADAAYFAAAGLPGVRPLGKDPLLDDIRLPGEHYRRNAMIAISIVNQATGISLEALKAAIADFPGSSRRFERLAENLYTDYGHHPVEITAVMQMAAELNEHVVLVYQPHQNRRQHELRAEYADCMMKAERIYWLPTYLSREDPALPVLSPAELIAGLQNRAAAVPAEMDDALWQEISQARAAGKLVIVMGAGNVDGWVRQKAAGLTAGA
ncbi:hypothetical protein JNJ66_07755 [Candidatus Saccharibacteria bacterium]|nr:hypothetical protein [Candidatus Saccharibacteria bacterium]